MTISALVRQGKGLLERLRCDVRGNTLAIVAAAMIPLTAMIGSGVDMARAYTVQARLQQACDAGALAGRRAMTDDTINDTVRSEANKFFNFNFPQQMYGTTAFTPRITKPSSGAVRMTADTTLPTMVMQIFGKTTIPVGVECVSAQDFINADIMLVLDVTGSMKDKLPDGKTKIEALRAAVLALYDQLKPTQDFLEQNGYRLRYSILPYSQTVNVGQLIYGSHPEYIRNPGRYTQITGYTCHNGDCNSGYTVYVARNSVNHTSGWFKNWEGCIEERQTLATAAATPSSNELADPRMKDLSIDGIPNSDPDTQWQPYDTGSNPKGQDARNSEACPTAGILMKAWTRTDLANYVNSLSPEGGTYHDIGMIWGARMLSANSIFGASPDNYNGMRTNKYMVFLTDGDMAPWYGTYSAYGTESVDRRISGGGERSSYSSSDNQYGDQALTDRHNERFKIACGYARNLPAQLYVIALATSITQPLLDCVNNDPDHAKTAANQQQLIAKFSEIGQEITELRLSK